ncbi:zonular occludens toxin domain-containing protein [Stenotrophomonas sp.]|uniref:zonular occludens toxin domain-containing protein n=1 Tax=Stenotrophomonas sp. TaxID=69392 RepID=UPI0028B1D27A|nr:zonular occludens toxin domain-containing protein [Stenotrophomonas sp.]
MFFQYTGQPGHGKTVLGIEFALEMKQKADRLHEEDPSKHPVRELYVCNVRDFNHGSCGALELTPDEVKGWHADPRFDHAIILIDEAYEHGMFPRRPPGRPVPEHVQQVAKHRHRGIDFVMICQSPKKQMDDFLHDLIEEHYHIRRRYGMPFVNIKRWDRFESNPDKAEALTTKRRGYPKHVFKLYTSTKYDTSQKRVPWFYWAAIGLVIAFLCAAPFTWSRVKARLSGETPAAQEPERLRADGAAATAAKPSAQATSRDRGSPSDYVASLMPRVPGQPWSAPIYDGLSVPAEPPRLFCMSTGAGADGAGVIREPSCSCLTEQGTRYEMGFAECTHIARSGQYEPFLKRQVRSPDARPSAAAPAPAKGV